MDQDMYKKKVNGRNIMFQVHIGNVQKKEANNKHTHEKKVYELDMY